MGIQRKFTNSSGRVFTVKVLEPGDRYGRNDVLTWEDDPRFGKRAVEFYDRTYAGDRFGEDGQFISRYYEDTLLERAAIHQGVGIDLQGDVPVWKIDGTTFSEIMDWVESA
jgi:hypothetical protein